MIHRSNPTRRRQRTGALGAPLHVADIRLDGFVATPSSTRYSSNAYLLAWVRSEIASGTVKPCAAIGFCASCGSLPRRCGFLAVPESRLDSTCIYLFTPRTRLDGYGRYGSIPPSFRPSVYYWASHGCARAAPNQGSFD
jgi:hypothetical protein